MKSRQFLSILVALIVSMIGAVSPAIADKLHLKDGRVLEGEVEREGEGFIYFKILIGGIAKTELFTSDQILRIEKDEAEASKGGDAASDDDAPTAMSSGSKPAQKRARTGDSGSEISDGATKVAFLSLEDMVGPLINGKAMVASSKIAKEDGAEVLVLVIDSGGGAVAEIEDIMDAFVQMKKDFRVVAWIRSAISGAQFTAFNAEEIYMMPQGSIGGSVGYSGGIGQAKAMEGKELSWILGIGEEISKRGKRNPLIMRSMQYWTVLSCDIDENGKVTWYEGDQGEYLVNPEGRILTLNSQDALKYGISLGTAETQDELMQLMGIREWVDVGQRSDKHQREFRRNVKELQSRAGELQAKFNMALEAARSARDQRERGTYVGRAQNVLNEVRSLLRKGPSLEKYMGLDKEWFEAQEEILEDLRKKQ